MNPIRASAPLLFGLLFLFGPRIAVADVPARPEFGVLDQAGLLPLSVLKATERMLAEHEQLTQERVSLFTLTGAAKGGLAEIGDVVFEEWRKTAPRPPNSLVILVNGDRGEIDIHTGLGLDPVLPGAKIKEIRKAFFEPEWRSGKKSRAVVLTVVEVLRGLDSPLVASGEVTDAYERAGFTGGWTPVKPEGKAWTGWFLALFGMAVAAFVLARIMVGEVHYTAAGWFRVPAIKNLQRLFRRRGKTPTLVTGGGVSGKY